LDNAPAVFFFPAVRRLAAADKLKMKIAVFAFPFG
jgi:hypothetical protein